VEVLFCLFVCVCVCVFLLLFFQLMIFPNYFQMFSFWESLVARTPSGDVAADSAN